jgi:hypothetical protein
MKSSVRKVSLLIVVFVPLVCHADGYSEIYGHTKSGLTVVIFEDGRTTSDIAVWRGNDQIAFYRDEPCSIPRSDSPKAELICAPNGKSPVAGATYLEKKVVNWSPGKPEYTYSCTSGCARNSIAPHVLERFPWE